MGKRAERAQGVLVSVLMSGLMMASLGLWLPNKAQAGPWTRAPGRWYAKLAQGIFVAEGFRDSSGQFVSDTTYRGYTTSAYGEFGLIDGLQAQFYLPFVIGENDFDRDSVLRQTTFCPNGQRALSTQRRTLGDALVGGQWTSPWLSMPHAVRVNAQVPLYDATDPGGSCGVLFAQPGDGQLDLDLWLSLGDSFLDGRLYAFGELGHRFRTEVFLGGDTGQTFGDTLMAFGQVGYRVMDGSFLMFNVNLAVPYAGDDVTRGALSLGPAVYWGIGHGLALELAVDFTPWATNAAEGRSNSLFWTAATIGVSHKVD